MAVTVLDVPSLSCASCEAKVTSALSALEGVVGVAVDLEAKTVTVDHADALGAPELAGPLDEIGFEVTGAGPGRA
jgi:copper chaperone CopZ